LDSTGGGLAWNPHSDRYFLQVYIGVSAISIDGVTQSWIIQEIWFAILIATSRD
jgi:hypothetical protein